MFNLRRRSCHTTMLDYFSVSNHLSDTCALNCSIHENYEKHENKDGDVVTAPAVKHQSVHTGWFDTC